MCFFQEVKQVSNNATIATIEEGRRETGVSSTTSSANTMDIVVDIGWEIVVDHMGDHGDVQADGEEFVSKDQALFGLEEVNGGRKYVSGGSVDWEYAHPLAATAVATMIGQRPFRKNSRARSRSR